MRVSRSVCYRSMKPVWFFGRRLRLAGAEGAPEKEVGELELVLVRATRRDGEANAADALAHLRAELEQLEADGGDGGVGELGVAQADAAHGIDQDVGHGREP